MDEIQNKRHTKEDLRQMQALPLDLKIKMTERRIREFYEYFEGDVFISFSGGKDSTVLKHIIDNMYNDVPAVFCDTGLEYPEIRKFAMAQPNTIAVRPKIGFAEVIKKYGYPVISKEVAHNVYYARQKGADSEEYKKLFGTLKDMDFIDLIGCEDTYETTGVNRTGCIFCMFGAHLDDAPNRFERLKITHPKQYNYCINGGEMRNGQWLPNKKGLGLAKVLDFIGVTY